MNKQNGNKIIDTENIWRVTRWERGWGLVDKGEGVQKYKLTAMK